MKETKLLVSTKLKLGAIIVACILGLVYISQRIQQIEMRAIEDVVQEYGDAAAENSIANSMAESKIREAVIEAERKKDEEYRSIVDGLERDIKRLSNRPVRSNTPSNNPECAAPKTGASLSREDAEFLTREAARADEIILERDYYYSAYKEAYDMLERLNNRE